MKVEDDADVTEQRMKVIKECDASLVVGFLLAQLTIFFQNELLVHEVFLYIYLRVSGELFEAL